ncbi:hypothetical protein [Bradyrhizobium sp. OAE829]|uniref:hypothetical protein n=1 Tax=Bradyrhizobium sp. OAE829 TaxID=2663807 RepID=UPI0019DE6296
MDGSKIQDAFVVLKTAKLEGDRVTFDVDVLEGDHSGGDGPAALFIDRFGFGGFHAGGFHAGGMEGFHAAGFRGGYAGVGGVGAAGIWRRPNVARGACGSYAAAAVGAAAVGGAALGAAAASTIPPMGPPAAIIPIRLVTEDCAALAIEKGGTNLQLKESAMNPFVRVPLAAVNKWIVVDMKRDWKRIFAVE